ncbi:hypothetical protein MANY_27150 [Mycolicibacterium anyangense]|uniref:Integral membrane protein n=1 Tax=Mycolicibacterium anyangense TaxID=1431246 RepID=A0A6N4WA16_9MYCO|nr:hypothetical protein [Mycolicibacterium anyangense]BBZ77378.1 hypothetical protein MANY_27150 [Mycolicibacterium anyangense]
MTAIATRPLSDSTDSLLRFALRLDATLTGFLGLVVATMADPMARLTGLTAVQEYAIGAVFVLYGLGVYALAAMPDIRRVGIALVAVNTVNTVALVTVAAAGLAPLTSAGVAVTLACSAYTAAFAALQYLGVRRLA